MARGLCSGSGWLLLLATLRAVLAPADAVRLDAPGTAKVAVHNLWTTADTITVSILPLNLTDHRIQVSVQQENDTSLTIVDTLPGRMTKTDNILVPIRHKVEELQPETRYEVCVGLREQENSPLQSECYKVKTFPKVDNVKGIYPALVAVCVFLVALGLTWLLYRAVWVKYFTKVLKVQDSQQVEQQVEGQSVSSQSQEDVTEIESTFSTTPTKATQ